tara:strand:- start:410 stop:1039 length:630 start_codon:yes stop_codon:yes gene_type:complete
MLIKEAEDIIWSLSSPGKMPGRGYGLPAAECGVGGKLQPIVGSTCNKCYALKGRYVFKGHRNAAYKRLASLSDPLWVTAMVRLIKGRERWFRWHDSGDLQSMAHLIKIVAVAMLTPATQFWVPTREFGLVKKYRDAGGVVPANLAIRLSAPMVGAMFPPRAGLSSMVLKKGQQVPDGVHLCPASKQDGRCGDCRACWDTTTVATAYPQH